jgi:hypothetical protein
VDYIMPTRKWCRRFLAGKGKKNGQLRQGLIQALIVRWNKIFFSTGSYRLIVESDTGTPLVDDFSTSGSQVCIVQTKQHTEVT